MFIRPHIPVAQPVTDIPDLATSLTRSGGVVDPARPPDDPAIRLDAAEQRIRNGDVQVWELDLP